ncbi:adenylyl-sulfate kinase [Desulfatiferula olefinivorans]
MTSKNSGNVTRHKSLVGREDRERLHGHKGAVVWFTGLSASGKSTVSHLVEKKLHAMGCSTYVFDGDNVRHGLCGDLGFSPEDRTENIRRIGEMVHLFVDAGIIALTAFISPFRADRRTVESIVGADRFIEIFVDCPLAECIRRDPKGMYARALNGEIPDFTGISSPYEPPESPAVVIRSDREDFDAAAERVVRHMLAEGLVDARKGR